MGKLPATAGETGGVWRDITPTFDDLPNIASIARLPDGTLLLSGDTVLRSEDQGATWEVAAEHPLPSGSKLIAHPQLADTLYSVRGTSLGIMRSTDRGRNFGQLLDLNDGGVVLDLGVDPSGTLWSSRSSRVPPNILAGLFNVWESSDTGDSWEWRSSAKILEMFPQPDPWPIVAIRDDRSIRKLATSEDGGRVWIDQFLHPYAVALDPRRPGRVWALTPQTSPGSSLSTSLATKTNSSLDLMRSDNGGIDWTGVSAQPFSAASTISFAVANEGLFLADGTALLRSENGTAWEDEGIPGAEAVFATRDGEVVVVQQHTQNSRALWTSADGGRTFAKSRLPLRMVPRAFAVDSDSQRITTLTASSPDGATWVSLPHELSTSTTVESLGADRFLRHDFRTLEISIDGASSYRDIRPSTDPIAAVAFMPEVQGGLLFVITGAGSGCGATEYRSDDFGVTWHAGTTSCSLDETLLLKDSSARNGPTASEWFALANVLPSGGVSEGGSPVLLRWSGSEDARHVSLPPGESQALHTVFFDGNDLVALGNLAWRSSDDGANWTQFLPFESPTGWLVGSGDRTLQAASSERGVWLSEDTGITWSMLRGSDQSPTRGIGVASGTIFVLSQSGLYSWQAHTSCRPSTTTLCLSDRFEVEVSFAKGTAPFMAQAFPVTADTGAFWFFDAANLEIIVKVLNGCEVNGSYWLFATGLTDLEATIRVTDPASQTSWSYTNPAGQPFPSVANLEGLTACE